MSPVEPRVLDLPMPEPGARHYVSPGIGWVRHPLPFALDHVNCWVLDDTDDIEAPPSPVGEENDDHGGVPAPSADLADDQMLFDAAVASERVATKCAVEVGTTPAADNVPTPVVAVSDDTSGVPAPSADLADSRCSSTRRWRPIR